MIGKESKILIIDDEPDICSQLSGLLGDIGYTCDEAVTSEKGLELFKKKKFSLVLLDIWLNNSKFDGFQALEKIIGLDQNVPVIMISGHGNIETAVNSIKKGAYDFIEKPFDSDLLIFKIKKALENYALKKKIQNFSERNIDSKFVSNSKSAKILEKTISNICKTDSNIFLQGSNGSGRGYIAYRIYRLSHRSNKNFKYVDCDCNENQLEKDLFGYEENQIIKNMSIFDEINNGTIYFKNFNFISNTLQGKLLRALAEKKFYRVGALNSNPLNIRVIISEKQNPKSQSIREDFLKKLNFTTINIPNLSTRIEDIKELIDIFSTQIITEKSLKKKKFSAESIEYLVNLNLLDNISQLKKFVEWIITMLDKNESEEISKKEIHDLGSNLANHSDSLSKEAMNLNLKQAREEFEKKYLMYNLEKFKYNVSKMSSKIGMERTALYRKLKSLNIKMEL
ncbi:MAG: sigma-54-dependent transcriptional regulator [Alphaproteobacteria bacterium]